MFDMSPEKLRRRFTKAKQRDELIAEARNCLVRAEQHGIIQWKALSDKTLRVWRPKARNYFVDWRPHRLDARLIKSNRCVIRKRRARQLDDILDLLDLSDRLK
jgi:hypothetical protein